jgi:hypothetical protein
LVADGLSSVRTRTVMRASASIRESLGVAVADDRPDSGNSYARARGGGGPAAIFPAHTRRGQTAP